MIYLLLPLTSLHITTYYGDLFPPWGHFFFLYVNGFFFTHNFCHNRKVQTQIYYSNSEKNVMVARGSLTHMITQNSDKKRLNCEK